MRKSIARANHLQGQAERPFLLLREVDKGERTRQGGGGGGVGIAKY